MSAVKLECAGQAGLARPSQALERPPGQRPSAEFHALLRVASAPVGSPPKELGKGAFGASVGRSFVESDFSGRAGLRPLLRQADEPGAVGRSELGRATQDAGDANGGSGDESLASAGGAEEVPVLHELEAQGSLQDPLMRSLCNPLQGFEQGSQLQPLSPAFSGGAAAAERVAALAAQWLRRFGHGGVGRSACVRLELGAGRQAGTELIVSGDRSGLRIVMRSPAGTDATGFAEGLRSRLAERGFQHVELELD